MRKIYVALLLLGAVGASAIGFVNCGGTNSGGAGTGVQFVNTSCSPDSSCLRLSSPRTVVVGETGEIFATLHDGSGNPIAGIEICFAVEDGAGSIEDPADSCGLTDSNGGVSGVVRAEQEGSHIILARAPSGFGLETRNTIIFTAAEECTTDLDCAGNEFCGTGSGSCREEFPANTCIALQPNGGCCDRTDGSQCISGFCDGGTCAAEEPEPTPEPTPAPACSDGVDNDGDGCVDFGGGDAGCGSSADGNELSQCGNGQDDDNDGLIDTSDPNCPTECDNNEAA